MLQRRLALSIKTFIDRTSRKVNPISPNTDRSSPCSRSILVCHHTLRLRKARWAAAKIVGAHLIHLMVSSRIRTDCSQLVCNSSKSEEHELKSMQHASRALRFLILASSKVLCIRV